MTEFKNRVFGVAIVKAVNANYNADFTHQPRTLPDGTVYATDKAFKYSLRNYLKDKYSKEKIFFFKRLNADMNPLTLAETYQNILGDFENEGKPQVLTKLLSCLDVRFFGATFAAKSRSKTINLSIHGPVQINHGLNRFPKHEIYSEQIMSPFRNPGDGADSEKGATTLGQQSKLREGHYVHHFSVNPQNLDTMVGLAENASGLTDSDIEKLKEAMRYGVTHYDSAAKAGTDNELLLWVELQENAKAVLPVFTEFITVTREGLNVKIDFGALGEVLQKCANLIEKIEVFYQGESTVVFGLPDAARHLDLLTAKG
jgi:CRISPR-associated protein Csh2